MRRMQVIGLVLITSLTLAVVKGYANDPKRIERRIHLDSTILSLSMHPLKILHNGDLVKARIHVDVHDGWQIGALSDSQKNNCECQMAFRVHLPDSLASNYEIVSLRETGKVTTVFDSDFLELRSYHTEPFDVIATLKARRKVKTLADFRLFAGYQAVNMIRKQCLPPSWYEVSLKKPDIVAN